MITRLLRINHWRARARYWRGQAETAKREAARLQLSLLAERYRNINREDYFVSAAVMGSRGMVGIPARQGPAATGEAKPKQKVIPPNWSGADLLEFETFWKADAEAAGISEMEAKRQFEQQVIVPRRQPLNDDPFN